MLKGKLQQKVITLVNIYSLNIRTPKYVKQILMDIEEIHSNTEIIMDFKTPLTSMDRSCRQKINMDKVVLNDTLGQIDLIDSFTAFYPKAAEYTFFASAHGMFSRIDHMLGHKTNLNKFTKIEIISNIFSDYNAMKVEINHKKKTRKYTKT